MREAFAAKRVNARKTRNFILKRNDVGQLTTSIENASVKPEYCVKPWKAANHITHLSEKRCANGCTNVLVVDWLKCVQFD